MITIPIRKLQNGGCIQIKVCEDATPGSWGNYQLLLYEYRNLEEDEKWTQVVFNYKFLKDKEIDYGPLWCVFCGKEGLHIYHWRERPTYSNMATVDHLIPRSKAPHLSRDKSNLRVACWTCNNKKAAEIWKEKFPYD